MMAFKNVKVNRVGSLLFNHASKTTFPESVGKASMLQEMVGVAGNLKGLISNFLSL